MNWKTKVFIDCFGAPFMNEICEAVFLTMVVWIVHGQIDIPNINFHIILELDASIIQVERYFFELRVIIVIKNLVDVVYLIE